MKARMARLSTTVTSRPCWASSAPIVDPAGPQPTTKTSQRRSASDVVLISSLAMNALLKSYRHSR
jgi:hypothetical protein